MKNVYLLPTDKPSRGIVFFNGTYRIEKGFINYPKEIFPSSQGFNIYITTDEEIKKRDCVVEEVGIPKKIILTTDPKLIADGVQAIDDEFLEWFVKNPSCEVAPIITTIVSNECNYKTNIGFESWKEEPKQEKVKQAAYKKEFTDLIKEIFNKYSNHTQLPEENFDYFIDEEDFEKASVEIVEWYEQFKKNQCERMYSKEVLKAFWYAGCAFTIGSHKDFKQTHLDFDQFYEQFKKQN